MGLRIDKKSYDYRSDKKATGIDTRTRAISAKPVIRLAANDNPNPTSKPGKYVLKDWREIKKSYAEINALPTDEERVIEWHKQNAQADDKEYVIVDKAKKRLEVHSADGAVVESFEIGIGKQKGDDFVKEDRPMTSAGIYTILTKGTGKDDYAKDYGANIFIMETERGSTGVSIHQIPNGHPEMYQRMHNGNLNDNRYSGGGIDLTESSFLKLAQHLKRGSEVYVLPEDSNNKIVARDGQLNLVQEKFTGQVHTSLKPTRSNPILIGFKSDKHETDTMKKFAKALEDKKEELMKKLGIDNDTYNDLASLALGLSGQESKFGESGKYQFKENHPTITSILKSIVAIPGEVKGCFSSSPSTAKTKSKCKVGCSSRGVLQMKLGEYTDSEVIKTLAEYGITKENPDVLNDPKNAAIAGMTVLANMNKNEVPAIKRMRSKMNRRDISDYDAITYMWHGRKDQLIDPKQDVNPDTNTYRENVRKFLERNFSLQEAVLAH